MKVTTPLTKEQVAELHSGMIVEITGTVYTARDAAHQKLIDLIESGKDLPFELKDQIIFYVGPTPAKPNQVIGSVGPTSSYRMDMFMEIMFQNGMRGSIGKGPRAEYVVDLHKKYKGVYFSAVGGAAAKLSKCVTHSEVIAFEELGTEAIRKLTVVDLPVIVTYDAEGNDAFYHS